MKKICSIAAFLTLFCGLVFSSAAFSRGNCTAEKAKSVEEQIDSISTWDSFASFYALNRDCDVSALSYAFTQAIARLSADTDGIDHLAVAVRNHVWLRQTVIRHLRSEAVAREDADKILANLRATCKHSREANLCGDIRNALKRAGA